MTTATRGRPPSERAAEDLAGVREQIRLRADAAALRAKAGYLDHAADELARIMAQRNDCGG
jgi:hypothetical protein